MIVSVLSPPLLLVARPTRAAGADRPRLGRVSAACFAISRCDDVEVGVEFVEDAGERFQHGRVTVELDLPGLGELPAAAGCSSTPTNAAFGPVTVSWVSGDAPRRALSTPRRTHIVQV